MKIRAPRPRPGGRPILWLALAMVALSTAPAWAALGDHIWTKPIYSGTPAIDANGNSAVFGTFFGTMDLGGGPMTAQNTLTGDVFLARFDASGDFLWSQQFTPINQAGLFTVRVAVAPNGTIYVAGMLAGSDLSFGGATLSAAGGENIGVLACFDPAGNHQWSFEVGTGTILGLAASDTKLVVVGELREGSGIDVGGGLMTSAGGEDTFVFELAPDGTHRWSKRFGDASDQGANAVDLDAAGNPVIAGVVIGTTDFGGGLVTVSGVEYYLLKLDGSDGSYIWNHMMTGTISATLFLRPDMDIAVGLDGKVAFGGGFRNDIDPGGGTHIIVASSDIVVAHYDADGNFEWSSAWGNTGGDSAMAVDIDTAGNVLLTGYFSYSVDIGGGTLTGTGLGRNHFVGVYDPAGNHTFSETYGPGSAIWGVFDPSNNLRLHGVGSTSDFGGGPVGNNVFLVKLEGTTNTPTGTDIPVAPVDTSTGDSPVVMTFDDITAGGTTSLTSSAGGPPPPGGLTFGAMATYYDLTTTAAFTGTIEVCFSYDEAAIPGPEADLTLQHYNAALPGWEDITTSVDVVNNILCGVTTSLSPFAIAAPEGVTSVPDDAPAGAGFALVGNAPNPFNPSTTIFYEVPEGGGHVSLDVYDAAGRLVRGLVRDVQPAGRQSVTWDGRDRSGGRVASGVYYVQMRSDDYVATRKMVLVE